MSYEYTILAAASVIIAAGVDLFLGTKLFGSKKFWVFWVVMFVLIFIVNGYLTWRPIVTYGEKYYLGIRIFTIPVEDFIYGFSLITMNITLWEFFTKRFRHKDI